MPGAVSHWPLNLQQDPAWRSRCVRSKGLLPRRASPRAGPHYPRLRQDVNGNNHGYQGEGQPSDPGHHFASHVAPRRPSAADYARFLPSRPGLGQVGRVTVPGNDRAGEDRWGNSMTCVSTSRFRG